MQKEAKNQDEKYNNPLDIFVSGSYGKQETCKINVRTLGQMAVGNSKLENQRFLLEPTWLGEIQGKQGIEHRVSYSRERNAGCESEDKSLTCQSIEGAGS